MTMPSQIDPDSRKSKRVDVRLSPSVKDVLERASALEGRSMSDFILSSAMAAAKQAISDHERLQLSARDREVFVEALLNPPSPTPWARDAARRFREHTDA